VRKALLSLTILVALSPAIASANWSSLTGEPQSLSSLLGQSLVVGDKVFSDFDMFGMPPQGGAIGADPDFVFVQGGQDDITGDYGLRLLMNWNAASGQTVNATLSFTVAILDDPEWANQYLKDVTMMLPGASATGEGVVNASETVWDGPISPTSGLLAALYCSAEEGDEGAHLVAAYDWTEHDMDLVRQIWVRKDLSITGGAEGTAHLSEVFQFFSQVPEPATMAMLAVGALTLPRRRKR
jgi:hypothetical protein